jgi:3-phenylpropionate/trans-cinnamate dioxygenase ferredoxin component
MSKVKLTTVSEIPECGMIMRIHENKFVMLAKVNGEIYAMDDICTHEEAPLHEGELGEYKDNPHMLTCPWHAAHFDIRTGKVFQDTPWATDTQTYEVEIEGDDVYVNL